MIAEHAFAGVWVGGVGGVSQIVQYLKTPETDQQLLFINLPKWFRHVNFSSTLNF